jgi:hypothetical protein
MQETTTTTITTNHCFDFCWILWRQFIHAKPTPSCSMMMMGAGREADNFVDFDQHKQAPFCRYFILLSKL